MWSPVSKRLRGAQQGVATVILAGGLLALLMVVGLAIDSARLYLTKRQLQVSADGAAAAAARMLVRDPTIPIEEVRQRSADVIVENLRRLGYPQQDAAVIGSLASTGPNRSQICFGPSSAFLQDAAVCDAGAADLRRGVKVEVHYDQPLLILRYVPGLGSFTRLSAVSLQSNLMIQAALVLDESGSMSQGSPNPPLGCAGCTDRMSVVKFTARDFVSRLAPFDQLAIVKFSRDYQCRGVTSALCWGASTHPPNSTSTSTLDCGNYSNQDCYTASAAAALSYYQNDSLQIFPAPVSQFAISDPAELGVGGSSQRSAADAAINSLASWHNTNIASGMERARRILEPLPVNEDTIKVMVVLTDGVQSADPQAFSFPFLANRVGGARWLEDPAGINCQAHPFYSLLLAEFSGFPQTAHALGMQQVARMRALDVLFEADQAQRNGIFVYMIGLGTLDTNLSSPFQRHFIDGTDPVLGGDRIKQFMMARAANDQAQMLATSSVVPLNQIIVPPGVSPPATPPTVYDFPCVPSVAQKSNDPQGRYYFANSGQSLQQAFQNVLLDVRSRTTW